MIAIELFHLLSRLFKALQQVAVRALGLIYSCLFEDLY